MNEYLLEVVSSLITVDQSSKYQISGSGSYRMGVFISVIGYRGYERISNVHIGH